MFIYLFMLCIQVIHTARILSIFPSPSKSHQIGFRPLIQELIKQGHEVTVIATDPAFKENTPINLTEVNIHDISYEYIGKFKSLGIKVKSAFELSSHLFELQLLTQEVQSIIRNDYDLLLIEMCVRPAIVFSHIFKAPVILINSFGGVFDVFERTGSATHFFFYPTSFRRKIYNLSLWDKVKELYVEYDHRRNYDELEKWEDTMLQRVLGLDVPPLSELKKNVDLYFLNSYQIWDSNRPVSPNVVYLGGLHLQPRKKLPKDLQARLNSSVGVIYVSFGTNVDPSTLPSRKIRIFTKVLTRLPFTILWKWEVKLPDLKNIVTSNWFPQSDLLHHPKVKLFITQGGLHSTYEAIVAGVPLLGVPFIADQWYNVEKYKHFNIGMKLDFETMDENTLKDAIDRLVNDTSYRHNILKLRQLMNDQPQNALDRAVWWIEYLLRHGGGKRLQCAGSHVSWIEYYEVELVLYYVVLSLVLSALVMYLIVSLR